MCVNGILLMVLQSVNDVDFCPWLPSLWLMAAFLKSSLCSVPWPPCPTDHSSETRPPSSPRFYANVNYDFKITDRHMYFSVIHSIFNFFHSNKNISTLSLSKLIKTLRGWNILFMKKLNNIIIKLWFSLAN